MKRIFLSAIALALTIGSSAAKISKIKECGSSCCTKSETVDCCMYEKAEFGKYRVPNKRSKVEILTFHTSQRCQHCYAIEELTREVIDNYFTEELKSGSVVLKVINISTQNGENLARNYQVSTTSLFINSWQDGIEYRNDITSMGFAKAISSPEEFKLSLKAEIARGLC